MSSSNDDPTNDAAVKYLDIDDETLNSGAEGYVRALCGANNAA